MVKCNTSIHNKFISTTTEDVPTSTEDVPTSPAEVQVLLLSLPAGHTTPLQNISLDVHNYLDHMTIFYSFDWLPLIIFFHLIT